MKRVPEKHLPSALLTTPKPLTMWITTNWKILQEVGIPDYLTCLLKNLYAGQEATVRTGHGTTDWFQIGKGVRQGYILSPCLLNLYAEYIMRNAGTTQRDGMGREEGGGFRMGNTCTPVADSCQVWQKPLQHCQVISLRLK